MYSLRLSIATVYALSINSFGRQMLPLNMRALTTSCTIDRPNALGQDGWKKSTGLRVSQKLWHRPGKTRFIPSLRKP